MNRKEYMDRLNGLLVNKNLETKNEIIQSFEEHFEVGKLEGRSEEEIAEELGDISEVINEISDDYKYEVKNEEYKEIKSINIDCDSADVLVLYDSNINDISVELLDPSSKLNVYNYELEKEVINDVLNIRVTSKTEKFFFVFSCPQLIIKLPYFLKYLKVKNKMGDLYLSKLKLEGASIEMNKGDFEAKDCSYDALSVELKLGDISIVDSNGKLQVKQFSGDIDIDNCNGEAMSLKTVSGDISVSCLVNELSCTTISGDIELTDIKNNRALVMETKSGDLTINDGEYQKMYVKTISGDIAVQTGLFDEGKFETVSGDISVDTCGNGYVFEGRTRSGDLDVEHDSINGNTVLKGDGRILISVSAYSGDIDVC